MNERISRASDLAMKGGGYYSLATIGAKDVINAAIPLVLEAVDRQLEKPLKRKLGPRRPGDPASLIADSTRLRETFDWRPEHDDLNHIVATALAWERKLRG
jgi:UDP-glucose 4-epimerase